MKRILPPPASASCLISSDSKGRVNGYDLSSSVAQHGCRVQEISLALPAQGGIKLEPLRSWVCATAYRLTGIVPAESPEAGRIDWHAPRHPSCPGLRPVARSGPGLPRLQFPAHFDDPQLPGEPLALLQARGRLLDQRQRPPHARLVPQR